MSLWAAQVNVNSHKVIIYLLQIICSQWRRSTAHRNHPGDGLPCRFSYSRYSQLSGHKKTQQMIVLSVFTIVLLHWPPTGKCSIETTKVITMSIRLNFKWNSDYDLNRAVEMVTAVLMTAPFMCVCVCSVCTCNLMIASGRPVREDWTNQLNQRRPPLLSRRASCDPAPSLCNQY